MSTKLSPNDPCWCKSGKKLKKCHIIECRPTNIVPVSRRIAKKVVSLWNKTTNGKVEEMTSDLELGQLRIAEFETYHHVESVDNLPVEGKVLKIDRRIKFLVS